MRHSLAWPLLLLLLLPLVTGCGTEPATPEAALSTARAFMEARVRGNAATAHGMLTARARESVTRSRVSRLFQEAHATYGGLGSPREVEPGRVRIPVTDLILTAPEWTVRWPESWLTLRYEENRWKVAWAEPLFGEAFQAYQSGSFLDQLNLGHEIVTIDPYHYRGYLELHFAYRGLARYREAEMALKWALERATPVQQPDVYDAMARFKLAINAPGEALDIARRAVALAKPYTPDTYSPRWQADTLVVAGRAALALNDRAEAEALADQATALDPDNGTLAMFRHQLAARPGTPPPAR